MTPEMLKMLCTSSTAKSFAMKGSPLSTPVCGCVEVVEEVAVVVAAAVVVEEEEAVSQIATAEGPRAVGVGILLLCAPRTA